VFELLKKKIISKKFKVGIIGLGYVGLPLAIRYLQSNIFVVGVDEDKNKIELIKKGKSYIKSINKNKLKKLKNNCSSEYSILEGVDVIFICLPTPLKNLKPDLSYIKKCMEKLCKINLKNKIIILESTVYPGATRKFADIILKKNNNFKIGTDFYIGYSPERENPGDKNFSYKKTAKVVSGYTNNCLVLASLSYECIVKTIVKAKNIETAETSKLLENVYRAVNIGMINEMKIICDNLSLNIHDIIRCAKTKNFGFEAFYPGPGWGGHCIPIDPFYLSWVSNQKGYDPVFIKKSGLINNKMPRWILNKVFKFFKNTKKKKPKILLLGISYKKNIDDDRESPAHQFINILQKKKIYYDYSDPFFSSLRLGRNLKKKKRNQIINKSNLSKYDCTIIITDHDKFDYSMILKYSKMIFDTRGVYENKTYKNVIPC
jgi:UDP-N-acetyl-D-glucosamine dehydrogenase